jgi:hypothetical protein
VDRRVTQLARYVQFSSWSFHELAVVELNACADQRDQVWVTARRLACADAMSLNAMATPAARVPGPLVTRVRKRTVAKVDSIGLVVRR